MSSKIWFFFGDISNNWPNDLWGTVYTKLLNYVDNHG